jgi:hypothetical protein
MANGSNIDTSSVGSRTFTVNATDNVGNPNSAGVTYTVQYAPGGICLGDAGHQILQPINADGSSVFKQGSTVPAKFRVCDANGNSIGGTTGVVQGFTVQKVSLSSNATVDENIYSTTPDSAFRWDPTAQQWIFNISTKNLTKGCLYKYDILLNDGSHIYFSFGLK